MNTNVYTLLPLTILSLGILPTANVASAQSITHQINLSSDQTWCSDSAITGLFNQINSFRSQYGVAALKMDNLAMKDAELRAPQFIAYMATHTPGRGFNPHEGYDTTAAGLGYNLIGENLAFAVSDPASVMGVWQDYLHQAALLASDANVVGISCVISGGTPFWTYEPGYCAGGSCGTTPVTNPPPTANGLDSEEWAFLTLINNYRAQNGAGPLQVSVTLEASSRWMSNDLAAKNYFSHTDSLGRSAGTRIQSFGYTYFPWGENIAAGNSGAQNTFNQWLNACDADGSGQCTYAHRLNMLNGSFKVIGIARAYGPSATYGWYWTTDFGGVVDQVIGQGTAPSISSFSANPSSITSGQSSSLTWNVSGATTVSISGIGDVTGQSSRSVTPSQTTSYTLTATNASGSATAVTTVTVTAPAGDKQAPTTPNINSLVASSSSQVDLSWTGSTDNVGVTGYQVYRNGSLLTNVGSTTFSYSDKSVSASTAYSYFLKAFDAAGNYSAQSNVAYVTTPSPVVTSNCPAAANGAFTGCYFNNTSLSGNPVFIRTDSQINFNWGTTLPDASVPARNFSVRWQGYFPFGAGNTTFTATTSDGMRIYIDGTLILDRWFDQSGAFYVTRQSLSQGTHLVTVEYYQRTGAAAAILSWNTPVSAAIPVINSFNASPTVLSAGQSTTLGWNVTGATSISISGQGDVTGSSSKSVTPGQTTTYVLTASNSAGSASAQVTVSVGSSGGGGGDGQAPTTPTITSANVISMSQVDLSWTASSDNVGVTGYQVIRNGSVIATTAGNQTSFTDWTVTYNNSYTYIVRAYDASGNYSANSNSASVTTPGLTRPPR